MRSVNKSLINLKYSFLLAFLFSAGLSIMAISPADTQDSLTLVKFQKEVVALGWPAIWDTTKNVQQWYGIRLEPVSGKVESIMIRGDDFGNFTTDTLPSCIKTLHSLDSLKELYFLFLGLNVIPPEIGGFKNLATLGIQQNNLSTVPEELGQLTSLEYLFVSSNKIMDLPDLSGLQNLIYLALTANWQLPKIPVTVFSLMKLQQLDFGYTAVTSIPADIGNLDRLEQLRADAADLDSISPAIGDLSDLTTLNLSNNNLTSLPESLGKLTKLTNLDISRNQLKNLPDSLNQLVNLTGIGFSDNQLDSFPAQLVSLPKLININGENNRMQGSIPPALFSKSGLRLYLEGNELSGKLEIQSNNIPARLYIKENCFTIKDIKEHYNLFNPANNTYIEFQPQKNIGTARTFQPESGSDFTVEIDNYVPAEGCTFTWLRSPYSNQDYCKIISTNQTLEFQNFNPLTDGGNYFCIIKHPDVPDLSLKSNTVRIIGTDKAPEIKFKNVLFRPDSLGIISVYATDDYTPVDSLIYNFPVETEHFYLESYYWPYTRELVPKNNIWNGTDTLYFSVEDENGNIINAFATITLLPVENTPPIINLPDIYMSFYQDYVPTCEPGTEGCNDHYLWESWTLLNYFVKDDFTPVDDIKYSLPGFDASGQLTGNSNVHAYVNERTDGMSLDTYVFANQDTVVTIILQATDSEGGISQQAIQLIAKATVPNQNPVTNPVPVQIIYKGETQFAPLNLNDYVEDDYLPDSLLTWSEAGSLLLNIDINDSIAMVSPKYVDSILTTTCTYYVYEKTNEWKYSSVDVTYKVLELPKISGTITDEQGLPLENVRLTGFPELIYTNPDGTYEIRVPGDWSGTVYPELEHYTFSPDTVEYNNILYDITGQDYIAGILTPESYHIRFTITDGFMPLENAGISLNGLIYFSGTDGIINIEKIEPGRYEFTVSKTGFMDLSDSVIVENNNINRTVTLSRITSINPTEKIEINYYPNPVKEWLNIEIPKGVKIKYLQICDINGKVITEKMLMEGSFLNISFHNYEDGVYLVCLIGDDIIKTIKIIKSGS